MGYYTYLQGEFTIEPELQHKHLAYLERFCSTGRRVWDEKKIATQPDPLRAAVGLPVGTDGMFYTGYLLDNDTQDHPFLLSYGHGDNPGDALTGFVIPSGETVRGKYGGEKPWGIRCEKSTGWGNGHRLEKARREGETNNPHGCELGIWRLDRPDKIPTILFDTYDISSEALRAPDEQSKFYDYIEEFAFLYRRFLIPWGYTVSGTVHYEGEESDDRGYFTVEDKEGGVMVYQSDPDAYRDPVKA